MVKSLHNRGLSRFILFALLGLGLAVLIVSCATRAKFTPSTIVPGATGDIKVKKDNNNNYSIDIEMDNLAEPNQLAQPQNVYVVWAEGENSTMQNLGQLKTSTGLLTGKLKAELETVTPFKPRRIFITGEQTATVQYPSNYIILTSTSF